MKTYIVFFLLFFSSIFCFGQNIGFVGDIPFDNKIDKKDFYLCDEHNIPEYFEFEGDYYIGEKIAIEKEFKKQYKPCSSQSGLVRIRFVVNCKGACLVEK
jgi:hypothetical protein